MKIDKDLIEITELELAELIRRSTSDRPITISFGPHYAAVKWQSCPWVLPIIAKMRGIKLGKISNKTKERIKNEKRVPRTIV